MNFNIYGIGLHFKSAPSGVTRFFCNEWNLFSGEDRNNEISISINFVDSINVNPSAKLLQSSYPGEYLTYDDGNIYLFEDQKIHLKLDEISSSTININCKKDINEGELFSILERLLIIKLIEIGHTVNHASCFKIDDKVYAFSSLSGVGKSRFLMHYIRTRRKEVKFISDDILILDKNFLALPYPRGINIKEYDEDLFYKILIQSSLKEIIHYFIHLLKKKVLARNRSAFFIRTFMHKSWSDVLIKQSKVDYLFILDKRKKTTAVKVPASKQELSHFLNRNIELEFHGFFSGYSNLLQLIDDTPVGNFYQYLNRIKKLQIENIKRFCGSVIASKILIDNDFHSMNIEKEIFS